MRLIDIDKCTHIVDNQHLVNMLEVGEMIRNEKFTDAIPIGFIDQVIDEYEHLIEHYLYDDDEDLKEYLCYRNCLNNLKRRWKRDRQKLRL